MEKTKTLIVNSIQVDQKLNRMAHEIYENHCDDKEIIIIGVAERGYILAERITKILKKISTLTIVLIKLEIDKKQPNKAISKEVLSKFDLTNKVVLLVDDVLNTGKTLIYGVKHILDFPIKELKTVVLVNRRHRNFPIRADYVGLTLSTTLKEHISVELTAKKEAVYLE